MLLYFSGGGGYFTSNLTILDRGPVWLDFDPTSLCTSSLQHDGAENCTFEKMRDLIATLSLGKNEVKGNQETHRLAGIYRYGRNSKTPREAGSCPLRCKVPDNDLMVDSLWDHCHCSRNISQLSVLVSSPQNEASPNLSLSTNCCVHIPG